MLRKSRAAKEFGVVLQKLHDDSTLYFGTPRVTLEPISIVDRGYSSLLRVRVWDGTHSSVVFIKKARLKSNDAEHASKMQQRVVGEFRITSQVYQGLESHPGLSAARPLACFPDEMAIVTEEATGRTLDVLLRRWGRVDGERSVPYVAAILERMGSWLKAFQGIHVNGRRLWSTVDHMRRHMDGNLRKVILGRLPGIDEDLRKTVMTYFDLRCRDLANEDIAKVSIHGDFFPENIIVNGTDITVLDFATATTGAVYHDISMMFLHVEGLKGRPGFDSETVDSLQRGMMRGLDPDLRPDESLFRVLLLHHLIARLTLFETEPSLAVRFVYRPYVRIRHRRWIRSQVELLSRLCR